jgi:Na+/H+ antiporter NhaD/arsenite permease-like protein
VGATVLFVALYALVVREWVHRGLAALAAATLAVVLGILSPRQALAAVNWDTLVLLFGLMLLARALDEAGWFRRFGEWARRRAGTSPRRFVILFVLLAAVLSAVLPNLAVVMVLAPPLLVALEALGTDPIRPLVGLVTAANFGGMATLVGDPPNVLIGTATHFSFDAFVLALGPPAAVAVAQGAIWAARTVPVGGEMPTPPSAPVPRDRAVLLGILALTVLGFVTAPRMGWPVGLVGLAGGVAAALLSGRRAERVLAGVDWGTLLFLGGLFVVVGGLERQGIIAWLAARVGSYARDGAFVPLVLGGTAVVSALLDNVPLVAAAIPMLARSAAGPAVWWALAAGAAIGGNATLIGSSANLVAASLAAERGLALDFPTFWRQARGISTTALVLTGLWLWATQGG